MNPYSFSLYFSDPWSKFNSHESLTALMNGLREKIADKVQLGIPWITKRDAKGKIEGGFSAIALSLKAYAGGHSYAKGKKIRIDFWQEDESTSDITPEYFLKILRDLLPKKCVFENPSPDDLVA